MGSVHTPPEHLVPVRIGTRLGAAFEHLEERIRERAYELFTRRAPDEGDAVTDWLTAQTELLAPLELVVKDRKHHLQVEGSCKGFTPSDIEVAVGDGELRVFGVHRESSTKKKHGVTQSSSSTSHFFQSVPLPCEVDCAGGEAKLLKNGKLSIKLPKKRDTA